MEAALTEVCKDIRVGKILIQTSRDTGEPELYYLRLPKGFYKLQNIVIYSMLFIAIKINLVQIQLGTTAVFIIYIIPV